MNAFMKKIFAAALTLPALAAHAVVVDTSDAGFLLSQTGSGYQNFHDAMLVMCGAPQPFTVGPGWICPNGERVDLGMVAVPEKVND